MQHAVRTLLLGIGEDLEREGLRDTPKRVAKALLEVSRGYRMVHTRYEPCSFGSDLICVFVCVCACVLLV
jgi:GTP cyclohydrolase I